MAKLTDEQIAELERIARASEEWAGAEWLAHPGPDPDGRTAYWLGTPPDPDGYASCLAVQMSEETARFAAAAANALPSLLAEVRASRAVLGEGTDAPATWPNERCPAHGNYRCPECLGVPSLPGARGGKGSLATVVASEKAMRRAAPGAGDAPDDYKRLMFEADERAERRLKQIEALEARLAAAEAAAGAGDAGLREAVEDMETAWSDEAARLTREGRHAEAVAFGCCASEARRALSAPPGAPALAPWYEADGSTVMLPAEEVERRRKFAAKVIEAVRAWRYAQDEGCDTDRVEELLRGAVNDLDAASAPPGAETAPSPGTGAKP